MLFFLSDYSTKTSYGTGVISKEYSPKIKLFWSRKNGREPPSMGWWRSSGKKPPSRIRVSNKPLKVSMDDVKDNISRLFKAISELMIRIAG